MTERDTLIREVGEGGLGKVWLARDNDLAREVAIKEIKPGTESSQAARRLIREAQITGQLQHPNIVPVYEVNRGGRPFYAMKLVKGETLSEAIQRHHAQPVRPIRCRCRVCSTPSSVFAKRWPTRTREA